MHGFTFHQTEAATPTGKEGLAFGWTFVSAEIRSRGRFGKGLFGFGFLLIRLGSTCDLTVGVGIRGLESYSLIQGFSPAIGEGLLCVEFMVEVFCGLRS